MCVVLANAYAGILFSFLSVAKLEQPINSIEEMVKLNDVQLIALDHLPLTDRFLVYSIAI